MDKKAEDLKKIMKQHKFDSNARSTGADVPFSSTHDLFIAFEDLCRKLPDKEQRDKVIENMQREPEDILIWNKDHTECKACWGTNLRGLITIDAQMPPKGFLNIGEIVFVYGSSENYRVTGVSETRITLKEEK